MPPHTGHNRPSPRWQRAGTDKRAAMAAAVTAPAAPASGERASGKYRGAGQQKAQSFLIGDHRGILPDTEASTAQR